MSASSERAAQDRAGRKVPLYTVGTCIMAPLGRATIRAVHMSNRADEYLVEIAYDNRPAIFTYLESELQKIAAPAALASVSRPEAA